MFTEREAQLVEFMANWYKRRIIEHKVNCSRNCNHLKGLESAADEAISLARKIRNEIKQTEERQD